MIGRAAFTVWCCTVTATAQTPVQTGPVRPEHQARVSEQACTLDAGLRTKAPSTVSSPGGRWTATVQETDPVVVPYDQARACIRVERRDGPPRYVTVGDFRMLRLAWLDDRQLSVVTNVGHVANVSQLLDVERMVWIHARTEFFWEVTPPSGDAVQRRDALAIELAKKAIVRDIDSTLPRTTAEEWLRGLAGPAAVFQWEVNDCGEQTGNPAIDRERDIPLCAQIKVGLSGGRDLYVLLAVGTHRKGVTDSKPTFYLGTVAQRGVPSMFFKTLAEVAQVFR